MLFGAISSNIHSNITIVFCYHGRRREDMKKLVTITKQLGEFKMIEWDKN